jgi:hypothetical protein
VNLLHHRLDAVHHLVIPETQDSISSRRQKLLSFQIFRTFKIVMSAVHFDYQLAVAATEVRDEVADGELSPEFEAIELAAAEVGP